jgi:hypothetical protein
MECVATNCLTILYEQGNYCVGGVIFLQSTFQVAFFVLHSAEVSKPPFENLYCLTFRSKFIMHNAPMKKKKRQHCFHPPTGEAGIIAVSFM